MIRSKLVPFFLLTLLAFACSTPKDVTYFQGIDSMSPEQLETLSKDNSLQIQPNDILRITVSSWDPAVVTPFNPPAYAYMQEGDINVHTGAELQTYLVDKDGSINFPVLGKVEVEGLTRQELGEKMQKEIAVYVPDAIVNVQIVNFRITILGEVARPGSLGISTDRISILDAIGRVGDVTINANRKNVLLIREIDGIKEFTRMDLTRPDLFASPYYYLKQNDIIYVEPNSAKKKNARYSQAQQYSITVFSSIMSALSIITTMVITIINNSKKD